jgi:polyphenol oxidase
VKADAVFTDVTDLTLTIRFADCQNAVIIAPEKKIIGLVHAGWRGVQSRIMTSAYALLMSEWGIDPASTFVGLGPSLCTRCAEFTDPGTEVPELRKFFSGKSIDLRAALDGELEGIGVPRHHRERLSDCTHCHPERYFTYRGGDREIVKSGKVNCLAVTLR